MNFKQITVFFVLFFFSCVLVSAQGFLKAEGKNIVDENSNPYILKGMGLGGWMVQEGYMLQTAGFAGPQHAIRAKVEELIGEADTDLFYEAWLNNHVRKADIDALKSWGFNSVRLPMHYNLFTLPIEEEPVAGEQTWLDRGFTLTDSLISWCRQNEMYVILDLHAAPGGQGRDQAISDYDPTKPSLWESVENQNKTVALWKRLAERYAEEPIVAGYDLLNEVNWDLPNNTALKNIYVRITEAIREVDTKHIIFIEGNWFANDFTGLTPPWEDNIVYSPHKYWSINDQNSIQWVLDIREEYEVPLYLGESGENSNTWFRDAIHLLEENEIGWAWWPMKKVEAVAGPLSVVKTSGYQTLLDYWGGGGGSTPSPAFAKAALMGLTENLKIENCIFQKDVIDAMFRQVTSDEVIPYTTQTIPGTVYSTDFDMGQNGIAYFDSDVANYNVSTGVFTAWNNGWAYRNDGVDIEVTEDNVNTNGYNIGWLNTGEWMQYDIDVTQDQVYDIEVRVASINDNGKFHFSVDGADLTGLASVSSTGGWQDWETVTIPDVVLTAADKKLLFQADEGGFNLGSFNFKSIGSSSNLATAFLSAATLDEQSVQLNLNKRLEGPLPAGTAGFSIDVNGSTVSITDVELNMANPRSIFFTVDHTFKPADVIRISYTGNGVTALDGTQLSTFNQRPVQNNIIFVHPVPGRIEAEDYFFQLGMQLETSTDVGGGQNIGFLDAGDYADYLIQVSSPGIYEVTYRTASESATGKVQLQIKESDGTFRTLHTVSFPPTGGWQEWANKSSTISFPTAGQFQIRLLIAASQFNINWLEFENLTSTENPDDRNFVAVYPNPGKGLFNVSGTLSEAASIEMEVYNSLGQKVYSKSVAANEQLEESIDLTALPKAYYYLAIKSSGRLLLTRKLLKL